MCLNGAENVNNDLSPSLHSSSVFWPRLRLSPGCQAKSAVTGSFQQPEGPPPPALLRGLRSAWHSAGRGPLTAPPAPPAGPPRAALSPHLYALAAALGGVAIGGLLAALLCRRRTKAGEQRHRARHGGGGALGGAEPSAAPYPLPPLGPRVPRHPASAPVLPQPQPSSRRERQGGRVTPEGGNTREQLGLVGLFLFVSCFSLWHINHKIH